MRTADVGHAVLAHPAAPSAGAVWLLKAVLIGAWLSGLLLTQPLWSQDRSYPLAPVFEAAALGPGTARALYFTLLGLLVAAFVFPRPRWLLLGAAAAAAALAMLDQTRWQPWFYQYFIMSIVLGCYAWDERPAQRTVGLDACRLLMFGTYFWSGVQKFNVTFVEEGFPWLLEPLLGRAGGQGWTPLLGWCVPFVEAGFALALLTRWRRWGVIAAVAMHLFILASIGPFGRNWNSVVWPWNVAMMLLVVGLFWNAPGGAVRRIIRTPRAWAAKAVLLLFGILPALSFAGLWDAYLSASLYSGRTSRARLWITPQLEARLPPEIRRYVASDSGRLHVDLFRWAFEELRVPPYPEERVYRGIARRLCAYAAAPHDLVLVVGSPPDLLTGRRQTREWNCSQLVE